MNSFTATLQKSIVCIQYMDRNTRELVKDRTASRNGKVALALHIALSVPQP